MNVETPIWRAKCDTAGRFNSIYPAGHLVVGDMGPEWRRSDFEPANGAALVIKRCFIHANATHAPTGAFLIPFGM